MRSDAVELVGEGVDEAVDFVQVVGDVPASVEFAAPGSDRPLDGSIELGGSRWETPEFDAELLALLLKLGSELGAAVDLDGFDGERHPAGDLFVSLRGVAGGGSPVGLARNISPLRASSPVPRRRGAECAPVLHVALDGPRTPAGHQVFREVQESLAD